MQDLFAGIDIGASATKAVLINSKKDVVGFSVLPSGINLKIARDTVFKNASKDLEPVNIKGLVTTGFGRKISELKDKTKTEISCHAKGCFHNFPIACTIVDIGGQDTKIIRLNSEGKIIGFKMNRKCAAGTGTFLEEIARRMDVPLDKIDSLARNSKKKIKLNSFCTVFSSTEILTRIREGESKEDMINGAFEAVVQRVLEMDPLNGDVVMTGGVVAYNKIVVEILEKQLGKKIHVPPRPQFTGALGAALYALDM